MRLAVIKQRAVLLGSDGARDVSELTGGKFPFEMQRLLGRTAELRTFLDSDAGRETALRCAPQPVSQSDLECPVGRPRQVLAIGANYAAHASEMKIAQGSAPATFAKFPSCLAGPNDVVTLRSETVDYEAELVVVIGRGGFQIDVDAAWDAVAGLAVGQDLSDRELQWAAGGQFSLGKSSPGYGPIGPWITTLDEISTPDDLAIRCWVDGELRQDDRTSSMLRSVPEIISSVSAHVELFSGDVIFTGSPAGAGHARDPKVYLHPGQTLRTEIEGLGSLTTTLA